MTDIYEKHEAAFRDVSAFVVLNSSCDVIAKVSFRYPRDGAGRLWCYFHLLGAEMVRAYASGGGYDKHSAAAHSAVQRIKADETDVRTTQRLNLIKSAIQDRGRHWDADLRAAGLTVVQAV